MVVPQITEHFYNIQLFKELFAFKWEGPMKLFQDFFGNFFALHPLRGDNFCKKKGLFRGECLGIYWYY